jgi:hypothetical protein
MTEEKRGLKMQQPTVQTTWHHQKNLPSIEELETELGYGG